jgi:hypothetical protein
VWSEAGGELSDSVRSASEILDAYRRATRRLLELAQSNAAVVDRDGAAIDDLWTSLYPMLEQVRTLEGAWNEFAYQAREAH